MADESKPLDPAEGGRARWEGTTPEERSEAARKAALARWHADLPHATHEGELKIGNAVVSAAVLPKEQRVLTQATFYRAIGRARSPKAGTGVLSTVGGIPFFLQASALKRFLTPELLASSAPVFFFGKDGKKLVGYDAELLPKVVEVYLQFRDSLLSEGKSIPVQYQHIITACDIVMRGLARVGIVALVDEATGYQRDRARDALAKILEAFIAKEIQPYVKTFDPEFYEEMFRLKGLNYTGTTKRPKYFGHLTNDIIYSRLAPGVLRALREKNPVEGGRRKAKHFQHLTENHGHPKLSKHFGTVIALMSISKNWNEFYALLNKHKPKQIACPLYDSLDENDE